MANLKDTAKAYEPKLTKNISDLEKVDITNIDVKIDKGKDKDGNEFEYLYIEVADERYRVPNSVLNSLKSILAKMPELKYISVLKQGKGMATTYQVLPLQQ